MDKISHKKQQPTLDIKKLKYKKKKQLSTTNLSRLNEGNFETLLICQFNY